MTIYFTSDLHFGHKNIVEYTDRGNATTQEEHDEWLINLWNLQVGKNDTVYHLGDFIFNCRKVDKFVSHCKRLNGQKFFIAGNHDSLDVLSKSGYQWAQIKELKIDSQFITLCHYAMRVWPRSHYGAWHLFGHSHGSLNGEGDSIDVGIDSAYKLLGEYRFFTMDDLRSIFNKE